MVPKKNSANNYFGSYIHLKFTILRFYVYAHNDVLSCRAPRLITIK